MSHLADHSWADGAAQCAAARSWLFPFASSRMEAEFDSFMMLSILTWRWNEHPPELGGGPQ
jgi:hypothetical protein